MHTNTVAGVTLGLACIIDSCAPHSVQSVAPPIEKDSMVTFTIAEPKGSRLRVEAFDPHGVRLWLKPSGAQFTRKPSLALEDAPANSVPLSVVEKDGIVNIDTGALRVRVNRATLEVDVLGGEERRTPLLTAARFSATKQGEPWQFSHTVAPSEHLLGLGEDNYNNGRLDRRGVIRELWAGQQINSGNVTAEYPVPLLISTGRDRNAYALFFDNIHRLRFDLAKTDPDRVQLDAAGGEIDLYVIAGPSIADVVERYTRLTGRPSLPPIWALGYWQSKCTYWDWRALDEAYEQLTTRGFPVDVMVIDYDWPEIPNNFKWGKRWIPEGRTPADKIAEYARRGVKIVLSQSGPMVKKESPTFESGWAAGVFATDGAGHPVEAGHYGGKLLDFTHPKINDWLWPQVRERLRDGVAGWWLDLTEPEGEPPQTRYYGGRPSDVHNEYSLMCTRSFEGAQLAETPDRRPFILTRTGSAGMQRHHAAVWTGDVYSDYASLRAHPPEMLNSGLSGLVFWTSDSGGFMNGYYKDDQMGAHARLYERWLQFSVFSPITRAHKAGGLPEPYQFGPAVEQSSLHYLKLRYRLLPYIYSYAWEASQTGLPLTRPLALEFQADAESLAAPGDQYLFGRELLVAPVLHEGQTNRSVYLPPGRWFDWDTGVEYAGGRRWVVAAPQNRIPLLVRAGAIIPLGPDLQNTSEKPFDPLTLEVFPSRDSSFQLYSDDGNTFGYRRGEFTLTKITSQASSQRVVLGIHQSNKKFTPSTYVARLHLEQEPKSVRVRRGPHTEPLVPVQRANVARLGSPAAKPAAVIAQTLAEWSPETRVLSVTLPVATADLLYELEVTLDATQLPSRPAPQLTADVIDPKSEAVGSGGKPVPHFFPPPALPTRLKAINYDKGGEGVAFHSTRGVPDRKSYRPDDFSIQQGTDKGGDFVLAGLAAGEWVRYTVDCGNGGWFELGARVASAGGGGKIRVVAGDRTIAVIDVPATGGDGVWTDVSVPLVYLNPGELSLMLYIESPGFLLNTLEFHRVKGPPVVYPAPLGARAGIAEVDRKGSSKGESALKNLGRLGSAVTLAIVAPKSGRARLRLLYQSGSTKELSYSVQVGTGAAREFTLAATGGRWSTYDLPVVLQEGANSVTLSGKVDGWDSVTLESVTLLMP